MEIKKMSADEIMELADKFEKVDISFAVFLSSFALARKISEVSGDDGLSELLVNQYADKATDILTAAADEAIEYGKWLDEG